MPGESRTSPRRIKAVERQRQALELRKAGATFEAIAKQLGYRGKQSAAAAVDVALKKTIQQPAEELRKLDLERLDSFLLSLMPKIRTGDPFAINTALNILARRAKLLGLDSPILQKLTIEDEHRDLTSVPKEDLEKVLAEVERIIGKQDS